MRPITHREDLKGSFVRLDIYHSYCELGLDDLLVIRRGVDSPLMDERFFGRIEQAGVYVGPQGIVRYG
ncbi:hypothetical protein AAVH_38963 [Aphelenchoides avenae]|nr:hypothetical protein AAVH_38963 [Aphelenchus avenae]